VSEKLRLTVAYDEPDEEGWIVARVVEVPGAISQGRTRAEARENVIDALRLMLSSDEGDGGGATAATEALELILVDAPSAASSASHHRCGATEHARYGSVKTASYVSAQPPAAREKLG